MKHLRKPLPYLSGQIECIFLDWESVEHARLDAASCFVFSGDPRAPFKELQSLLIERAPASGHGNSNNNSRPPLAGRRPLTTRAGAGGERWEVSQEGGSLRSYILGRLHVLPRQPLKWLHLISMVLITSDRKPSIQGSSIKQTNPIWREDKRVSTWLAKLIGFCTILWMVEGCTSHHF